MSDHHEQRRMFALLDEIGDDPARLGPVWDRLAILLEVHADAEEQLFYPRLLHAGTGVGGTDSAAAETKDAIHDHNQIRDAIHRAAQHPVGGEEWCRGCWRPGRPTATTWARRSGRRWPTSAATRACRPRHDLAVEFAAFEAAHAWGVAAADKDPARFVEDNAR